MKNKNITWTFGNAPFKPETHENYLHAIENVIKVIKKRKVETEDACASISEVKGMFNKIIRQDRWDWNTVNEYFGSPANEEIYKIVPQLVSLRKSLIAGDKRITKQVIKELRKTTILDCFNNYIQFEAKSQSQNKMRNNIFTRIWSRIISNEYVEFLLFADKNL